MNRIRRDLELFIARTACLDPLNRWIQKWHAGWPIREWKRHGRPPPPPPVIKHGILKKYARKHGLRVFVETGTCMGDTVEAMRSVCHKIYSVELSPGLFEAAANRFAGIAGITLLQGDSAKELPRILSQINGPALFWLDGHYSGDGTARGDTDTPIEEELRCILDWRGGGSVILIDDARLFGSAPGYPTLAEMESLVHAMSPSSRIKVADDIIRITGACG